MADKATIFLEEKLEFTFDALETSDFKLARHLIRRLCFCKRLQRCIYLQLLRRWSTIPAPFTKFLEQINGLTDSQLRQVEKRLEGNDEVTSIVKQLEQRMVDSPECPHLSQQPYQSSWQNR